MKKYGIVIGFAFASLTIGILCGRANPQFFLFQNDHAKMLAHPSRSPATVLKDLPSNCNATSQFRYTTTRTGVAPDTARPQLKVSIVKHIEPFNVDIHGASKSSPTIDDTGVYVGTDSGQFLKMNFDGEVIWRFFVPGSDNGIHASAAMDDKKVYIGAYNGFMYALDKENGDLVWATPVGDYVGASPLLANGHLYIAAETAKPDGLLAKLDCNTGTVLWNSMWLGGHSHSSPAYDDVNKTLIVGANSGRIFAFAEDDGRMIWKEQMHGPIKGTPMIHKDAVYFSSWDKNFHGRDVKTGKALWESFMGGKMQSSLTLVPSADIGVTNTRLEELVGLDLKNGEILWRLRHGDNDHMASILVTKNPARPNQYIAWARCKRTQLCALDGKTGVLLHNVELPGSFTSMPFAYNDKIYIALDEDFGLVILQ